MPSGLLSPCLILFTFPLLTACGSTSVTDLTEVAGPTSDNRCQSTVSIPTIPAAGGRVQAVVQAARECSWTVRPDASWVQVSPSSGQGETTLTLTANENPENAQRSGAVTLNGQRIAITQEAAPCRFTLASTRVPANPRGGVLDIGVTTASACAWSISSSESWALPLATGVTGPGLARFSVQENRGGPRSTTVRIAGQSVTVTQDTAPADPEPEPQPTPAPVPGLPPIVLPPLPLPTPECHESDGDGGKGGRDGKGKKRDECDN